MSGDPIRLASSEEFKELADTVRTAQGQLPDDATVARLATRLGLGPSMPPAKAPAPGSSLVTATAAKVAGVTATAVAIGVAGWFLAHHRTDAGMPEQRLAPAHSASERIRPVETAPPPTPAIAPTTPTEEPARGKEARPIPPQRAEAKNVSEVELIRSAESLARSDPAKALQLTREHERLFPSGALAEEREVLAIESLVRLGDMERARARADRFLGSHPYSAHSRRVQRAVGRLSHDSDGGLDKKK